MELRRRKWTQQSRGVGLSRAEGKGKVLSGAKENKIGHSGAEGKDNGVSGAKEKKNGLSRAEGKDFIKPKGRGSI